MNITGSSRSQLKTYFIKHAMPSEGQFAELIEGMLNQRDDRVVKPQGGPLSLEAAGEPESQRPALHLYESFGDANPAWALTMNPRATASDPSTARRGLSIDDATGVSRLFVDHTTGNVGIGTLEPEAALHVVGALKVDQQQQWQNATLLGTWANLSVVQYGHAGYYKDSLGHVHIRGCVTGGGVDDIFYLPEGYRPATEFAYGRDSQHGVGRIDIHPNGRVRRARGGGWTHISGICFRAEG